eukprot:6213918-Pleurochrysis_carterae.AAC.1
MLRHHGSFDSTLQLDGAVAMILRHTSRHLPREYFLAACMTQDLTIVSTLMSYMRIVVNAEDVAFACKNCEMHVVALLLSEFQVHSNGSKAADVLDTALLNLLCRYEKKVEDKDQTIDVTNIPLVQQTWDDDEVHTANNMRRINKPFESVANPSTLARMRAQRARNNDEWPHSDK